MKRKHLLLILIGCIPLAAVVLPLLLAVALAAYDFIWGLLFRLLGITN
jgi:hypothetical protein